MALSALQEKFVEEFIKCRKGAEAARRAGYSTKTARVQASRLLTNVNVLAEIEARTKENGMGIDEALSRLADVGRGSMEDFTSFTYEPYPAFVLDLGKARKRGVLHLIKSLKYDRHGRPSIELYSAADANKFIAELHNAGPKGSEKDPIYITHIKEVRSRGGPENTDGDAAK